MKTILVPTDFSKNAMHAAEYAAMLANQMHANIVFLNTFNVPIANSHKGNNLFDLVRNFFLEFYQVKQS